MVKIVADSQVMLRAFDYSGLHLVVSRYKSYHQACAFASFEIRTGLIKHHAKQILQQIVRSLPRVFLLWNFLHIYGREPRLGMPVRMCLEEAGLQTVKASVIVHLTGCET